MIHFPSVKLQDQTIRAPLAGVKARIPEPFVLGSTMTADAREKSLVPAARGLNVPAVDEAREDYTPVGGEAATCTNATHGSYRFALLSAGRRVLEAQAILRPSGTTAWATRGMAGNSGRGGGLRAGTSALEATQRVPRLRRRNAHRPNGVAKRLG